MQMLVRVPLGNCLYLTTCQRSFATVPSLIAITDLNRSPIASIPFGQKRNIVTRDGVFWKVRGGVTSRDVALHSVLSVDVGRLSGRINRRSPTSVHDIGVSSPTVSNLGGSMGITAEERLGVTLPIIVLDPVVTYRDFVVRYILNRKNVGNCMYDMNGSLLLSNSIRRSRISMLAKRFTI